ncbi:MAG: type 4a pilus biogenesis protein PilO [Candidatus Eremiobacteraeota bacterium]|nr:type 4a pilus biogenesis protein PilO [Candidatus Eremiobacteraeota bacterium]
MNAQLSTLNRLLIVGGLFIVIALCAFFFFVQPKKNQEALTRSEIADLQAQYDDLKRVADQKPLYLAFTDQVRKRLKGVEITADPRLYVPSYLKQIEDLAGRDGLIVTSISPQATPSPSASGSPSPAPGTIVRPNLPGAMAQPFNSVAHGLGGGNANGVQPNAGATGPAAGIAGGATPVPGAPAGVAGPSPGPTLSPERAAAIAYLTQSFQQVPVNMEFDGRYDSLERFLRDLAKFQKLIGVGDLTIAPSSNTPVGVSPRLKITLPIVAYRLSPNTAAPGPLVLPSAAPTPKPGVKK